MAKKLFMINEEETDKEVRKQAQIMANTEFLADLATDENKKIAEEAEASNRRLLEDLAMEMGEGSWEVTH